MTCSEKKEPKGSASSSTEPAQKLNFNPTCACGHGLFSHGSGARCIGNRNLCTCLIFRTEGAEEPERKKCGYSEHGFKPFQGYRDEPGKPHCLTCGHLWGECNWHWVKGTPPFEESRCPGCDHEPHLRRCLKTTRVDSGPARYCGCALLTPLPVPEEPPLTPEEEEQAPEDRPLNLGADGVDCVRDACPRDPEDCNNGCRLAADELTRLGQELPPPEGPEYRPCACGHIEPQHEPTEHAGQPYTGECRECDCGIYRPEPDPEAPPQPDRRPPYAVAYSVQGHLYEVALSGDATVKAVDGALIIQHHLGPVAGIVQVLPVINEENNDAQVP